MPHTVSFDEDDGIVTVWVSGAATADDHRAARDGAMRLCREKGGSKLLVDLRELDTRLISTMSCFGFGSSVTEAYPGMRIARVVPTDARSREDGMFVSNIAANRGASTGEFDSIDGARKWLLEGT